jgi:hypothetical protein
MLDIGYGLFDTVSGCPDGAAMVVSDALVQRSCPYGHTTNRNHPCLRSVFQLSLFLSNFRLSFCMWHVEKYLKISKLSSFFS